SADAWGRLGQALLANGLENDAAACFAQAERLDPRQKRWPYYLGMALHENDPEAAVAAYRRADGPRLKMAETLIAMGRPCAAAEELAGASAGDRQSTHCRYLEGVLAAHDERWQDCVRLLKPLTDAPQARRRSALLLATAYLRLGNSEQASQWS